MKIKSILKVTTLGASLLLLAACSNNMSSGQGAGARSMGLGAQGSISGTNANRLRAPQNQSYYFDFDKSGMHTQDLASIDAQAAYLVRHKNVKVLLAGNTDSRGSREYNIALGERRDLSIADRLEMDGVRKQQIKTISFGAEKPVALGHTEADYKQNRRVDLTYLRN